MGDIIHSIGRLTLVVINLLLMLIALAMTVAGCIIKFGASVFSKYTDSVLESVKKAAQDAYNGTVETGEFDFDKLFGFFGVLLIVIGVILLLVSIFGCCGACCKIKTLLILYAVVLGILVVAQITFVILFFRYNSVLKDAIRKPLKESLDKYHGLNGSEVDSLIWNFLMQEFDCCGIDGWKDFDDTTWFGGSHGETENLTMPLACCKTLPDSSADFSCAESLDHTLNNYDTGCLDSMWSILLEQNELYSYIVSIGVVLFQVILLVFAMVLYCKDDKSKVNPDTGHGNQGRRNQERW